MTEHAHALLNLSAPQLLVRSSYINEMGWGLDWRCKEGYTGRLLLTEDSLIFAVCFMFAGHISMCCEGIRYYLYSLVGASALWSGSVSQGRI